MNPNPETRTSLLIRVRDSKNQAAWLEFVEIYRPVILRLARQKGLQDADAEDVAQQILVSVAKSIEQRPHDSTRAKFRTWLSRVAHNAILNSLMRGKPDRGSGDSSLQRFLSSHQAREGPDSKLISLEHRRELFRWASRQVRQEFQQATWDAFWLTAVEGQPIEQVADGLGKTRGSIYAARSRIVRRIQEKIAEYDQDDSRDSGGSLRTGQE